MDSKPQIHKERSGIAFAGHAACGNCGKSTIGYARTTTATYWQLAYYHVDCTEADF